MTDAAWLEELDLKLEASKVLQNRRSLGRVLHLPAPPEGGDVPDYERCLASLLEEDFNRRLADAAVRYPEGEVSRKLTWLKHLRFKTRLRKDAELADLKRRARSLVSGRRFELAGSAVGYRGLLEVLACEPREELRASAWAQCVALDGDLRPIAQQVASRHDALAQASGYPSFPHWIADRNNVSVTAAQALMERIEAASRAAYRAFLSAIGLSFGSVDPADFYHALEAAPRPVPAASLGNAGGFAKEQILPAFHAVCDVLGFDDRARTLKLRETDLPFNALTLMLAPPEEIYVLSAPFDSFRCWRVLFHEFGHFLQARYNLCRGYLFKWEEAPCFQEGMAQTISHMLVRPAIAAELFGGDSAAFVADQRAVDLCRLRTWLASALDELALYGVGRDVQAGATPRIVGTREGQPGNLDALYFIFYPFHFQNMLIGDLIARSLHLALPAHNPAAWLCENFYADGSSVDWKRKFINATGCNDCDLFVNVERYLNISAPYEGHSVQPPSMLYSGDYR